MRKRDHVKHSLMLCIISQQNISYINIKQIPYD